MCSGVGGKKIASILGTGVGHMLSPVLYHLDSHCIHPQIPQHSGLDEEVRARESFSICPVIHFSNTLCRHGAQDTFYLSVTLCAKS